MQVHYLTKSDYKVARTCPTKLYYLKQGYPTRDEEDEYLAALREQGYLVEALARALFPDGRWVGYQDNVEAAAWETMAALRGDPCTLFEATFISGSKMARVDILHKRGSVIELIEIKSCAFDRPRHDELTRSGGSLFRSTRQPGALRASWQPYIEDAAFQTCILQDIFPEAQVVPFLLMPDTSRPNDIDGLHHNFEARTIDRDPVSRLLPAAEYKGDMRELRRSLFLARVDVRHEVALVQAEVRRLADEYAASIMPELRRLPQPLSTRCRKCEYRVNDGERRGFHDCWGDQAATQPHILDLYHVGTVGSKKKPVVDELIAAGKTSLFDIPERHLTRQDGGVGDIARRQRIQLRYTRENREWISDELGALLTALPYPHHFVDFETCAPAVPRYRGLRPFEPLAFQWCCQTIAAPDAKPAHSEWLQEVDAFPNLDFAGALRRQLGDQGAVLVWSDHEATILKAIQKQMAERGESDSEIYDWLSRFLAGDRLVDMNKLTRHHYFHPRMGGSTSLKVVADAVWQTDSSIRARLSQYVLETPDGVSGPYASLPPVEVGGRRLAVVEGTGAILAYYTMIERAAAGAVLEAERWRQLLRQYCKLDTLAMVMVWWRWLRLTGQAE